MKTPPHALQIVALPALKDNYIWLLRHGSLAALIDPGDASVALTALEREQLELCAVLVTHHHADHCGGLPALRARWPQARYCGPHNEAITGLTETLTDGDHLLLAPLGLEFTIIATPGHTRGHLVYYEPKLHSTGALFSGDTLFSAGCGRLFEGSPAQMHASLTRLRNLPPTTRLYCAHEYTEANLRFAQAVEPGNTDIQTAIAHTRAQRATGQPSLPTTLAHECTVNPFLRWDAPAVQQAAARFLERHQTTHISEIETFTAIRVWKNGF
jgi:hydroxyacylglutathione hydrolase